MSRPRARVWPAVVPLLALLTMLAAGCGDSDGDAGGVASLRGSDGGATTTTGSVDRERALLDFARCLRANGVPIKDPQVDADGNLRLQPGQGGAGNVDQATVLKAREACREHLEGVTQGFTPQDQTRPQDSLVSYARCMRQNGYDMPDPDVSQGGLRGILAELDRDDPAFKKAHERCQQQLAQLQGRGGSG